MRQIDNMSDHELEVLRLKNMLPETKPIQRLHPTFKACSCGFVGTKTQFYRHIGEWMKQYTDSKKFFKDHGEVPINEDDPRTQQSAALSQLLEESAKKARQRILEEL
jgi:hypothetical protein